MLDAKPNMIACRYRFIAILVIVEFFGGWIPRAGLCANGPCARIVFDIGTIGKVYPV